MQDTKAQIGEKAFALFLNEGFHGTSMANLLKAVGISKGAFYHHFESKTDVYRYVIERYFIDYFYQVGWEELQGMSLEGLREKRKTFYRQFIAEVQRLTNQAAGKYFILCFEAFYLVPDFKTEMQNLYDQLAKLIQSKYEENGFKQAEAHQNAIREIAEMEGLLFWQAVFPERNVSNLI